MWLYAHRLSFRAIAKFLNVSDRSIFVWVKKFAENNYTKPVPTGDSVVVELDEMWHFIHSKKRPVWIWKAYCRTTKQLIDWQCGKRDCETFAKMYKRLQKWNVKIYFTDKFGIYRDFINPDKLVQTKSETHLIECNNFR